MAGELNLSKEQIDAIANALAGKLRSAGPAGPVTGETCPVCGHVGAGVASGPCANNNCVRHDSPEVVGLHPESGEPMTDKEEHAAAVAEHALG